MVAIKQVACGQTLYDQMAVLQFACTLSRFTRHEKRGYVNPDEEHTRET